ncbi:SRPBCC family protein [Pedobacter sp. UBA5917]|jgi:PhnB protein|uniref:SRPBCC family protein n=1 Tax=Pedobacter sp. UBA5917 TaxID=1947061 RepID=UPI0025F57379|nr:SRPBCC domain-containing protein [Pedobacter sp. UBA5917]
MSEHKAVFTKDTVNKKVIVKRAFDAPLANVWKAWTDSEILDQWWAPYPYRAVTKTMDFREGGFWLYQMLGPEGDGLWCKENFKTIEEQLRITNAVSFCDEDGKENVDFPTMHWKKEFTAAGETTVVDVEISYDSIEDMNMFIQMGMQEGFTAGLDNLDQYFEKNK